MNAEEFEAKLKKFISENGVRAEHLHFEQSCHSVPEAAQAANAPEEDFVKNILMISKEGKVINAITPGKERASTTRVGEALGIERPELITPEKALEKTGYPLGGTP
ncbi:MAG: YbaK/EbsC family protein, partial [Candidatus Diapherotrites archaeon]|nr:YbaK/EbsC family protein [Candidatus Diapherotrites archaeon]